MGKVDFEKRGFWEGKILRKGDFGKMKYLEILEKGDLGITGFGKRNWNKRRF